MISIIDRKRKKHFVIPTSTWSHSSHLIYLVGWAEPSRHFLEVKKPRGFQTSNPLLLLPLSGCLSVLGESVLSLELSKCLLVLLYEYNPQDYEFINITKSHRFHANLSFFHCYTFQNIKHHFTTFSGNSSKIFSFFPHIHHTA